MTRYDTPIEITLADESVTIIGTDTGSYVAQDGRTWLIPGGEPATDAPGIEAHIAAAQPSPEEMLADRKTQLRNVAKARRAALIAEGFEFGGKLIQTRDQVDIDNVNSAALRAASDPAFATNWITTDNSALPLDAAGLIAMQAAMVERGNAIFAAYLAVADQLEGAEDLAALDALAETAATFAP